MIYVSTEAAPEAFGPFCQATVSNGLVFTSGALPLDPATGAVVDGGMAEQTRRTMDNLSAVLEAAGSCLEQVLQITIYVTNTADFESMNEAYQSYFGSEFPARVTVGAAWLAKGAMVEIQAIAYV